MTKKKLITLAVVYVLFLGLVAYLIYVADPWSWRSFVAGVLLFSIIDRILLTTNKYLEARIAAMKRGEL